MLGEAELLALVAEATESDLRVSLAAGWIVPSVADGEPRYQEIDAARLRLIHELRTDLGVEDEAIAVVLSLLDQIHALRHRLARFAMAIAAQPEEIQRAFIDALSHDPDERTERRRADEQLFR